MAGFDGFEIADDQVDFSKYAVQPEDAKRWVRSYDVMEEICELSFGKYAGTGLALPWAKWKDQVRFQRGKWSIWGGFTHHGKTHALKHLIAQAIKSGEPTAILSLEERPAETLFDICCLVMQDRNPDRDSIDVFCNWVKDRLWIYDQKRLVTPERIIGVANYAARELGVYHVMVDSLMRTSLDLEDQEATKVFGNMIGMSAEQWNYHFHLVAHQRKGDEAKPGGIYDVKGAAELVGQADKVFTMWRNKVPRGERIPDKHYMCDAILTVDKQRGRPNWIGKIPLDYHYPSTQLITTDHGADPVEYIRGIGQINKTPELFPS
jgi:twinkle protein